MATKMGLVLALDGEQQFKQGLQNAQKQVKLNQQGIKELSAEYKDNANSLEYLQKKQQLMEQEQAALTKKLDAAKIGFENATKVYDKQKSALDDLKKKQEAAAKALEDMEKAGKSGTSEYEKQKKELEKLNDAVEKQTSNVLKADGRITDWQKSINTTEHSIRTLNNQMEDNVRYIKEAEEASDKCAKSIDKTGKAAADAAQKMADMGEAAGDMASGSGNGVQQVATGMSEKITSALVNKGIGLAIDAAKNALASAGEAIKDVAVDSSAAMAQLKAATGLTADEAKRYESVMLKIKGDNFGDDYSDVASAMQEVLQVMGHLDDESLTSVTENAITLRDTFDMDINESIRAVDTMMTTMGVDAQTAFDYISAGAQNGLDRSHELTDNLTEYSQIWGQAGFSAKEMFSILQNGLDNGAYNLDKVNDFVKEFTISLSDGRIEDSLDSFSDKTQNLFYQYKNGEVTANEVFYSVISDLENMTDKQEALTLASNTWSALGEDNAMDVITSLNDVCDAYDDVGDSMEDLTKQKFSDLQSAVGNVGSAFQEHIIAPIATAVAPAITTGINAVANGINEMFNPPKTTLENFIDEVEQANDTVSGLLESATDTMNGADVDVTNLEAYKNILIDLNSQESLSEFQKYQLKQAVDELGSSVPGLSDAFDEETGTLKLTNAELEDMFNNAEKIAVQNAIIKAQKDSYDALAQATLNKARADSAVKEAQDELQKSQEELYQAQQKGSAETSGLQAKVGELAGTLGDAEKEQKKANAQYEEAQQQVADEKNALADLEEQYGLTSDASETDTDSTKENTDAKTENTAAVQENVEAQKAAAQAAYDTAQEQQEAAQTVVDAYTSAKDTIKSSFENKISLSDMFDQSEDGGIDLTVEEMTANLQSQVNAMEKYRENMETVVNAIGDKVSPEFIKYIQDMGMEGANTLEHMVITLETQGTGPIEEMAQTWADAMNVSDSIASAGAANQAAMEQAAGDLGSTASEWSSVWTAISAASDAGIEAWSSQYSQELEDQVEDVIATAQQCGVAIPSGLADGIASGDIGPQEAIDKLTTSIQGQMSGLLQVAQQAGIQIPEGIKAGIQDGGSETVEAYNQLIQLLSASGVDLQEVAAQQGTDYTTGLKNTDTASAGSEMAGNATDGAESQTTEFSNAGTAGANAYIQAISNSESRAKAAANALAAATVQAMSGHNTEAYNIGANIGAGVAQGLMANISQAEAAANASINRIFAAMQKTADIHSPSKRARKDIGQQITAGTAFGIKDKESLAGKNAKEMSEKVFSSASAWLTKYKKKQNVSIEDEKYYWQQVAKHCKSGSAAYIKAQNKILAINRQVTANKINQSVGNSSWSRQIANNFNVDKYTGTGKNKKSKDAETYYSDVYSAAEKYVSNQKVLQNVSTEQERNYWASVVQRLRSGTQAYYDARKKVNELTEQMQEEREKEAEEAKKTHVSMTTSILSTYKKFYSTSERAEMQYWDIIRKQFAEGTEERVNADASYLEACQSYYDARKELDEQYRDDAQEINDDLIDNVKDLQDAYKDAVSQRKSDILSQFDLFEAWDSTGYDADTLLHNLNTQVSGLALWEQQFEELSKKNISQGLLDELKEMGPEAAASIYSLNHMTEEQLQQYDELWKKREELAQSQAVKDNSGLLDTTNKDIDKLQKDAQKKLNELNKTYQEQLKSIDEGISGNLASIANKAGQIGEDAMYKLISQMGNTWTALDTSGKALQPIISGVDTSLGQIPEETGKIGQEAIDSLLEELTNQDKIQKSLQSVKDMIATDLDLSGLSSLTAAGSMKLQEQLSINQPEISIDTSSINSSIAGISGAVASAVVQSMSGMGIYIDEDKLVGQITPAIESNLAMSSIRKNGRR